MKERKPAPGEAPEVTSTTPPRRSFVLEMLSILIGGLLVLFPTAVGLVAFFDPLRRNKRKPSAYRNAGASGDEGFVRITSLDLLPEDGMPMRFPVIKDKQDAWNFIPDQPIGAVFVTRTGPAEVKVFNATCPHAGCSVSCDGNAFHCPCHNSSFNLDGSKRISDSGRENPSPRPLDELQVDQARLAEGEVWIEFVNFFTGTEEKIPKA